MLNKYKTQFETKWENNNLKAAKSESVTASKFKIKKVKMWEIQWQIKTQKEQKNLKKLCNLKK